MTQESTTLLEPQPEKLAFHNTDPGELARRRKLASAREGRERERRMLVARLAFTEHRATLLRSWIGAYEGHDAIARTPELSRMLDWARGQLETLDAAVDPVRVAQTLSERNLFPAVDEFYDPFGDPPARQPWGR